MVHCDFEWGFIADLIRSIMHNSENTHQNENRFLAFGSLASNAEVENAMISVCIIVCSELSGI